MKIVSAFVAGFLSTLTFNQGLLAVFHLSGATPLAPYSMAPTGPLHVPEVVSLAFFGGLWGVLLWLAIRQSEGTRKYWVLALVLGAIVPSIVALFVVFPLKGQQVAGGWQPALLVAVLLLNGAWGIGTAFFLSLFRRFA